MSIRIGSIVRHPYRKQAIYRVTETHPGDRGSMRRVRNTSGYPDMGDKNSYRVKLAELTEIAFAPEKEDEKAAGLSVSEMRFLIGDSFLTVFNSMCGKISPEYLGQDGLRPVAERRSIQKKVQTLWASLESYLGYSVSEDDVFRWKQETGTGGLGDPNTEGIMPIS